MGMVAAPSSMTMQLPATLKTVILALLLVLQIAFGSFWPFSASIVNLGDGEDRLCMRVLVHLPT